jgi:hypothetical protein
MLILRLAHVLLTLILALVMLTGGFQEQLRSLAFPTYASLVLGGSMLMAGVALLLPIPTIQSLCRGALMWLGVFLAMCSVAAGLGVFSAVFPMLYACLSAFVAFDLRRFPSI